MSLTNLMLIAAAVMATWITGQATILAFMTAFLIYKQVFLQAGAEAPIREDLQALQKEALRVWTDSQEEPEIIPQRSGGDNPFGPLGRPYSDEPVGLYREEPDPVVQEVAEISKRLNQRAMRPDLDGEE